MIFGKTDTMFENAAVDEAARNALLTKFKRIRSGFVWTFSVIMIFFIAVIVFLFFQLLPILHGDFDSFDPSISIDLNTFGPLAGVLAFVAWLSPIAAGIADNQVKMLILIDRIQKEKGSSL